ncbi:MAG: YggS family pyridoxal phosphate-dependent enzyme [Actinomycetota bacterium]|nr:YggS family pyridoxal phosphate-dependent enzyme [Actinomycetota bacterium]
MTLAERLAKVRARIAAAAADSGRDESEVTLVAVSKTFSPEAVAEAVAAGVSDLGENRAQELRDKVAALGPIARWHFVGHLQSNKVRHVVGSCALIHSVDSTGVAEEIAARAQRSGLVQEVLVEVNVSGEASKHGVDPSEISGLLAHIHGLEGIDATGLMTIPPWPEDAEESRPFYQRLSTLARDHGLERLSMGMTRDFEIAIAEGATLVRVGEAIFGERSSS